MAAIVSHRHLLLPAVNQNSKASREEKRSRNDESGRKGFGEGTELQGEFKRRNLKAKCYPAANCTGGLH